MVYGLVAALALALGQVPPVLEGGVEDSFGGAFSFGGDGYGGVGQNTFPSLIRTTPQTVVHVGFTQGANNYFGASTSPCVPGNTVNSVYWTFFQTTCVNDAVTGPDGLPADQLTKTTAAGTAFQASIATSTSQFFSTAVVGKHPTATGFEMATATCPAAPSSCDCTACITTDGSTCGASQACTASASGNDCRAYTAIDNTAWTRLSLQATCASGASVGTWAVAPGRPGLDAGATAYLTDAMAQDSPPSAYIPTTGTAGLGSVGAISGMRVMKGAKWTLKGGVRQNMPIATTPPRIGVGPFVANYGYYEYPAVDDPMDLRVFSACAVVVPSVSDLGNTNVIWHDGVSSGANGAQMVLYEVGNMSMWASSGGVQVVSAMTANVPNLVCWGGDTNVCHLRLNKGTSTSAACNVTADRTLPARLGLHWDLLLPFKGLLVEFWFSRETPSAAVFSRVAAEVESRGGITLP